MDILRSIPAAGLITPHMMKQLESVQKKASVPPLEGFVALPTSQRVVLDELIAELVQFGTPILMRRRHFAPKGIEGITQLGGIT
ncbi:MAG: hypothetical protein ABSG86_07295 [Thermoguttaceae bacterium]